VNLIGAALIGVVAVLVLEKRPPHRLVRPFVVTGLLGGFTTFSALSVETVRLIDVDAVGIAVAYVSLTVVLGLLLVRLAVVVTRAMVIGRPATGRDSSGGSWE
jgi:CrcB protein